MSDWNILQITQFLKIQRTAVTEQILLNKNFSNSEKQICEAKMKKLTDEEKLRQVHKIQGQNG